MRGEVLIERKADLDRLSSDPYTAAMLTWLEGKAENTRRAYTRALRELLADAHPSEIEPLDVAAWQEGLKRRGLTDTTVAHRLSVISSYYNLAREETT